MRFQVHTGQCPEICVCLGYRGQERPVSSEGVHDFTSKNDFDLSLGIIGLKGERRE